jgi:hypothetical protein
LTSDSGTSSTATLQGLRSSVDSLSSTVTFQFREDLAAGLEGGVSSIRYTSGLNDGVATHVGLFAEKRLSNYTDLRISLGYQRFSFGAGTSASSSDLSAPSNAGTSNGLYGSIVLRNNLNRYLRLSLSAGREADVSFVSSSVVTNYIREEVTLKLVRGVEIHAHAGYEYSQLSDTGGGDFSDLYVGVSASYALNQKLSVSLGYDFYSRFGSNGQGAALLNSESVGNADYRQNRVTLSFSYVF